ncbi:uncharacterized protein LOC128249835 [Octopus bimaculoides]|uniref:uncharacterized protein LOC128249835 n=1 Tax=Octopus bimaculoides TaxID=37653 RepID=UPI0022E6C6BE|nr:uncharacterized protein LOC128249835 [Octopus bimaculoides]
MKISIIVSFLIVCGESNDMCPQLALKHCEFPLYYFENLEQDFSFCRLLRTHSKCMYGISKYCDAYFNVHFYQKCFYYRTIKNWKDPDTMLPHVIDMDEMK